MYIAICSGYDMPSVLSALTLLFWHQEEHLACKTRRPASADRTARPANFRRDL